MAIYRFESSHWSCHALEFQGETARPSNSEAVSGMTAPSRRLLLGLLTHRFYRFHTYGPRDAHLGRVSCCASQIGPVRTAKSVPGMDTPGVDTLTGHSLNTREYASVAHKVHRGSLQAHVSHENGDCRLSRACSRSRGIGIGQTHRGSYSDSYRRSRLLLAYSLRDRCRCRGASRFTASILR